MKIHAHELRVFIETARSIAGRAATEMFSLEDVYWVSDTLGLSGAIFLEQFIDTKHVTVLLSLDGKNVYLYDPLSGMRAKPYDEIQFGLHCQPVGGVRAEYRIWEQQQEPGEPENIWAGYRARGNRLSDFLKHHERSGAMYAGGVLSGCELPILQNGMASRDCAPISLFVMSLFGSAWPGTQASTTYSASLDSKRLPNSRYIQKRPKCHGDWIGLREN